MPHKHLFSSSTGLAKSCRGRCLIKKEQWKWATRVIEKVVATAPPWFVPCMLQAKDDDTVSMEALQPKYVPHPKADEIDQVFSVHFTSRT